MRKIIIFFMPLQFMFLSALGDINPEFVLKTPSAALDVIKYKSYYYVSFDLDKPAMFSLISELPVKTVEISPENYHIQFLLKENTVHFTLDKPGYILIRINDSLKVFVFAEKPEILPAGSQIVDIVGRYSVDATGHINETLKIQQALDEISGSGKILFFPPGKYKTWQLAVRGKSRIYIARGAVLEADTSSIAYFYPTDELKTKRFIYINGVENVEISGYGAINGNGSILRTRYGDDARMRLILAVNSKNIRLEGLLLKDPGSWNTHVLLCEDVVLRNIKLLNDIDLSNTDGFDPDGVKRMSIDDCFAYCSDDNVAVKTTGYSGLLGNVENVKVRGCVFLTKKSALKVGTETLGETMKNITFENNDVIESDRGMALYVSDGAVLDSIVFRNNRFERNYPDQQRKAFHFVVSRRNSGSKLGTIKGVLIENCHFETPFPRKPVVRYEGEGCGINVTIVNLTIAERKMEREEIEATNASVVFK